MSDAPKTLDEIYEILREALLPLARIPTATYEYSGEESIIVELHGARITVKDVRRAQTACLIFKSYLAEQRAVSTEAGGAE